MKRSNIYVFALFLFCTMCRNSETPIDSFFDKLEKSIETKKLIAFKNAPKDSASFYFERISNEFFQIYYDSSQLKLLNKFFEGIYTKKNIRSKFYYLCFAFHAKLNNEKFNNDELIKDSYQERLKISAKWDKKMEKLHLENIINMKKNNIKYNIGDVISVVLPVEIKNDHKFARYYNNDLERFDHIYITDSLMIIGKILKKEYNINQYLGQIDTSEVIFKLKLLNLSNPKCNIFDKKYQRGDVLDFHLRAYGKLII